ncbi:Ankyrin repeat-containing protein [Mycena chlorophos]|uniref:Ankyrin repeat-containing protein n=1 Tax=Mycena chlorophos TaxID=658473 RepID=A0A8H6TKN0_MYCCL|nr:Ankyrin repeat-containing protein [Mycena chlorophos]
MSTVFEDAQSEAQLSSALGLANAEAAVSHHSRGKGDGDEARVPRGSVTFLEESGLSADDLPLLLSRATLIYSFPHAIHFRYAWDSFVDTLVREWKAQALVSALLTSYAEFFLANADILMGSSALLSLVQLSTNYDPISRTLTLLALLCALINLSFAALYIVHFATGPCRRVLNAARLAQALQNRQLTPSISMLWNPCIFLALPSIWFAWTVLLFLASLMVFTWRTYLSEMPPTSSVDRQTDRLVAALLLCAVLVVAVIGLLLVLWTLSRWSVYHSERHAGWDESNKPEDAHAAPPATEKPSSPHRVWHTRYVPGPSSAPPNPHANGSSSYAFAYPGGTSDSPLPPGQPLPIPVVVPQGVPSVPSRGRSVRYNRRTTVVPGSGAQAVFPEPKAPAEFAPVKVLHVSPRKDGGLDISLDTGTADSVVIGGGADSTGHDMRGDEMATFGEATTPKRGESLQSRLRLASSAIPAPRRSHDSSR